MHRACYAQRVLERAGPGFSCAKSQCPASVCFPSRPCGSKHLALSVRSTPTRDSSVGFTLWSEFWLCTMVPRLLWGLSLDITQKCPSKLGLSWPEVLIQALVYPSMEVGTETSGTTHRSALQSLAGVLCLAEGSLHMSLPCYSNRCPHQGASVTFRHTSLLIVESTSCSVHICPGIGRPLPSLPLQGSWEKKAMKEPSGSV